MILKNKDVLGLEDMSAEEILQDRYGKFRAMGEFEGSIE